MGNCKFCDKKVGIFKSEHAECKLKNISSKEEILKLLKDSMYSKESIENIKIKINKIADSGYIVRSERPELIYKGWDSAIDSALEDNLISQEEEDRLYLIITNSGLEDSTIKQSKGWNKLVKGAIIRDILNGKIPERVKIDGLDGINFQTDEKQVWGTFCTFSESQVKTQYVGSSIGASIRIAKGLYVRTSSFKGNPVKTEEMTFVDSGVFVITNKNVYFNGMSKSFRIKYDKIVSFKNYSDSIGIIESNKDSKLKVFTFYNGYNSSGKPLKIDDGWFVYNLITNISRMKDE
jgi:hypothetical protein